MIGNLWNTLLYIPLLNVLVGIYQILPIKNLALAIFIFTVLTRLPLWPLTKKSQQYQKAMRKIQPELDTLKKKYENDKEKLYQETMKLYSEHKANPASGCLPLLIQLPFTLALYQALREGLDPEKIGAINDKLYAMVPHVESFNTKFLWLDFTSADPFYILPILVGLMIFLQTKSSMGKMSGEAAAAAKSTMVYMPLMILFITLKLPSGLTFYILLTTLFGILQQMEWKPVLEKVGISSVDPAEQGDGVIEGEVVKTKSTSNPNPPIPAVHKGGNNETAMATPAIEVDI
jgi:YidC/Oxa1 family membrane protein insertase